MTDEEIIKLSEKTRKEKYCNFCEEPAIYDCSYECKCPIAYFGDCHIICGDTIYETGFCDGFKAAMEYFNQIIKKLSTDDKFDDDFNYYGGYKRAFNDIQEELGMYYDKD